MNHPSRTPSFLGRYHLAILITTLLLFPIIAIGAIRSLKVHANDIRQWLPQGFEAAETHHWFTTNFGVDEMVVISWEGAKIGSADVENFRQVLEQSELNGEPAFSKVTSGQRLAQDIKSVGISEKVALARLDRFVVGVDGETTCVLGFPQKSFGNERRELVELIFQLAKKELGIDPEDLHLGGPVADGAAVDRESKKSLNQFLWYTVLVVFGLAWYRMGDFKLAVVVIVCAMICAAVSLSILHWTGGKMNLTMVMLPTLTFILGVSGSVHMANYYRSAVAHGDTQPADRAMKHGVAPVLMSSITTAIGLASLGVSQVTPIREFGIYSALGVVFGLPVVLLLLPTGIYLLFGENGREKKKSTPKKANREQQRDQQREQQSGMGRSSSILITWVCKEHWLVTLPCLVILVALAIGSIHLKASVKIQNRFSERTKIIQDYGWLESKLGPLVPMEVILRFDKSGDLTLWEQLEVVRSVESALKKTTDINATFSAVTFRPKVRRATSIRGRMQRRITIEAWTKNIGTLSEAKLYKETDTEHLWRISARVAALNDIDYGNFLAILEQNVDKQIEYLQLKVKREVPVKAVITGSIPLIYQAQHQILFDLLVSFLGAFFFISLILIYVLKSFRAGLIAMVPNIFPPVVVFGGMGWLGVPIEIGSVMTASVALGIAVDDTIHFLTWYRRGYRQGKSRFKSIQFAFHHCAKAMIDTTLICGLGVAPFLLSVFMPTVRFSRLMLILLSMALVGDLILLPAILAGPAGLLFQRARKLFGRNRKEPKRDRRVKKKTPESSSK